LRLLGEREESSGEEEEEIDEEEDPDVLALPVRRYDLLFVLYIADAVACEESNMTSSIFRLKLHRNVINLHFSVSY